MHFNKIGPFFSQNRNKTNSKQRRYIHTHTHTHTHSQILAQPNSFSFLFFNFSLSLDVSDRTCSMTRRMYPEETLSRKKSHNDFCYLNRKFRLGPSTFELRINKYQQKFIDRCDHTLLLLNENWKKTSITRASHRTNFFKLLNLSALSQQIRFMFFLSFAFFRSWILIDSHNIVISFFFWRKLP